MAMTARRLASLPVIATALGLAAFGVIRGVSSPHPASGTRMSVAIEGPVDDVTRQLVTRIVEERIDDTLGTRIIPAGDRLVVEVGTTDPELASQIAALLERRGTVELRTLEPAQLVVAGSAIRGADTDATGVAIQLRQPRAETAMPDKLAVVFDGRIKGVVPAEAIGSDRVHLTTDSETAFELATAIEAGAAPQLRVEHQTAFSHTTGFVPRAWPLLVPAIVLLIVAALLWRRR